LFDDVSNQAKQEKRYKFVQNRTEIERNKASNRIKTADAARRKKTVQDSLKELEDKQLARHKASVGLKMQISQGLVLKV
jgi:tight adherence protein B